MDLEIRRLVRYAVESEQVDATIEALLIAKHGATGGLVENYRSETFKARDWRVADWGLPSPPHYPMVQEIRVIYVVVETPTPRAPTPPSTPGSPPPSVPGDW